MQKKNQKLFFLTKTVLWWVQISGKYLKNSLKILKLCKTVFFWAQNACGNWNCTVPPMFFLFGWSITWRQRGESLQPVSMLSQVHNIMVDFRFISFHNLPLLSSICEHSLSYETERNETDKTVEQTSALFYCQWCERIKSKLREFVQARGEYGCVQQLVGCTTLNFEPHYVSVQNETKQTERKSTIILWTSL